MTTVSNAKSVEKLSISWFIGLDITEWVTNMRRQTWLRSAKTVTNYYIKEVSMPFEFTIPGKPQAKARPRFTHRGGVYTTSETIDYERYVRSCFQQARTKRAYTIDHCCPILISIEALFPIPPSWSKAKQLEARDGRLPHTSKPDWDNVAKIVTDALNGLAWKDDSQIISATVIKRYSDEPKVLVTIWGTEVEA